MASAKVVSTADEILEGAPKKGDVIGGKYLVDEVLGAGGMGVVVGALHTQLGERVAVKVLLPRAARLRDAVERFLREAKTAAKIKSDHVVRVLDVGSLPTGSPYIVMEYLEGRDLADLLQSRGRLPVAEAVDYVIQACAAAADAHALGVVHRDLKPSNLFLASRSDGTPILKVVDFGISKALEPETFEPGRHALTETTATFGSPAYMSPEQIRSAKHVDTRTDVWALGVILFELLTAETPFVGETSPGLLAAIAADPPRPLRTVRPDLPAQLEWIIAQCLVKDVAQRMPTVGDLAQALLPFGSSASQPLVERIQRTAGMPRASRPSHSPQRIVASVSPPAAFTATEPSLTVTATARSRLSPLASIGVGLVVGLVAALGIVASRGYRSPPSLKTAQAVESPVVTLPPTPSPPTPPAVVLASTTAAPSEPASAAPDAGSLPPAGTAGTMKAPRPRPSANSPSRAVPPREAPDPAAESH